MNFLRPFSEPPPPQPVYTQAQLKKMATMGEFRVPVMALCLHSACLPLNILRCRPYTSPPDGVVVYGAGG